jgi:thymidylate synthase ThyX
MIQARIIADSINEAGDRIVTWILTYPRMIHAELMTHRVFSRNAASSRAIPIAKMIEAIRNNPAMPEFWGANQKGMQAAIELAEGYEREHAVYLWLDAADYAADYAKKLADHGVHKQIANRVIEPWSHITVLMTTTDHLNFFGLRAHKDAQPEFQVLAYMMLEEYLWHQPQALANGEWHIPFGDQMPEGITHDQRLKIATARAARVSYLTFEGTIDPEKDYALHDGLAKGGHWSPFEHCAQAKPGSTEGNFTGWLQYRKFFPNENRADTNLSEILDGMPDWVRAAIARNRAAQTSA